MEALWMWLEELLAFFQEIHLQSVWKETRYQHTIHQRNKGNVLLLHI